MPLNIISYKKAIWKGIEGHLKGIVQKLEDSPASYPKNHAWPISLHGKELRNTSSEIYIELQGMKLKGFTF